MPARGGRRAVAEAQPQPIAHQVVDFQVVLVEVALVDRLGLLKVVPDVGEELILFRR